jgi:hypothetical protein
MNTSMMRYRRAAALVLVGAPIMSIRRFQPDADRRA